MLNTRPVGSSIFIILLRHTFSTAYIRKVEGCSDCFFWFVKQVGEDDSVILVTHEPNWLLDWYWDSTTGSNVAHFVEHYLKGRCRLRIAGDLHNYMRHKLVSGSSTSVEHLIVNGSGGAFLHPTHVFGGFNKFQDGVYEKKFAYPSFKESEQVCKS